MVSAGPSLAVQMSHKKSVAHSDSQVITRLKRNSQLPKKLPAVREKAEIPISVVKQVRQQLA